MPSSPARASSVNASDIVTHIAQGSKYIGENTQVVGDLDLESANCSQRIEFRDTTFDGHVNFRDAHFSKSISFMRCTFKSNFNASGAVVEGSLNIEDSTFEKARQPEALVPPYSESSSDYVDFERLQVAGNLMLHGCQTAAMNIELTGASVGGQLYMSSSNNRQTKIGGDLLCVNIRVGGQVNIQGTSVAGTLQFQGANLGSDLFVTPDTQGRFESDIGGDIFLIGIAVNGQLDLSGSCVKGEVSLNNAKITEDFFFRPYIGEDANRYIEPHFPRVGKEVDCSEMAVKGTIDLSGLSAEDDLTLRGVSCDGQIHCGDWNPRAPVAARSPKVGKVADFSGCRTPRLTIHGLLCDGDPRRLNLSFARVGVLEVQQTICASVNLQGFDFSDLELPSDSTPLELLKASDPFFIGTWTKFENWSRSKGQDDQADEIYLAMRARNRQHGFTRWAWFKDWLLSRIGYGLQSNRLVWLLIAIILSLFLLFDLNPKSVVSKDVSKSIWPFNLVPPPPITAGAKFWLAFRIVIPVVAVFSGSNLSPSDNPITIFGHRIDLAGGGALCYDQLASMVSVIGWVIVPLFFAGVTGVFQKRR